MTESGVAAVAETAALEEGAGDQRAAGRPGRVGRRRWGTYVLWVATFGGFVYLFIPLITIAVFSFNQPQGRFNTEWQQFTLDNWANAFESSDYIDAFVVSLRVAFVSCIIARLALPLMVRTPVPAL